MIITLKVADFKIANHLLDATAHYISELKISTLSIKKGTAADRFQFSLPLEALDHIGEELSYLVYDTRVDLFIDNMPIIKGYITKIDTKANNIVNFEVLSVMAWHTKQFFSPSIEASCQNQTYSKNCGLTAANFRFTFNAVEIDCLTGFMPIAIAGNTITLGGNMQTVSSSNNDQFLDLKSWSQATVIINNKYKSRVIRVTEDKIYLAMNYLDRLVTVDTISFYLKCDRLYGTCFSRFNNSRNFWGFANTGQKLATYDIFSSTALAYCGEDLVTGPDDTCPTDNSLFGITL